MRVARGLLKARMLTYGLTGGSALLGLLKRTRGCLRKGRGLWRRRISLGMILVAGRWRRGVS